jgi:post-segregation antitoxin (ccd killing protein)
MMLSVKERVTISIEPEALAELRADVGAGRAPNISAAAEKAILREKKRKAMREYIDMWEEEFGPISEEAREWARKELERAWGEISSSTRER